MRHFNLCIHIVCGLLLATSAARAGLQFETPVATEGSAVRVAAPCLTSTIRTPWTPLFAPPLLTSIESFDFVTNPLLNDTSEFTPVDATCAVGPEHVVNAGNCIIEWRTKDYLGAAPQYRA